MESAKVRARLLELAESRRTSLSKLSVMLGKNPSYLQQFIRKGSPRKLEEQDRGMLARFFDVAEEELGKVGEKSYDSEVKSRKYDWIDIPRLRIGPAKVCDELDDELSFATIRFSQSWLRSMGFQAEYLSTILITGDSMEPTLRDGDEILVDRAVRLMRDGVYAVRLGDSILVKRLDTGRSGVVILISDNPAYPPVECDWRNVEMIGRVVWKGGRI